MNLSVLERPICFFDLETTGVDIYKDRIIEISIKKINLDGSKETFYSLVNPQGTDIRKEAFEKHGISAEDLADKPTFNDIAQDVLNFIKGCDLAGYNIRKFDVPFLVEEMLQAKIIYSPRGVNVIDVLQIYFKMEPRDLSNAYYYFTGKCMENAHSAEADVDATIDIFEAQLEKYKEQFPSTMKEINEKFANDNGNIDFAGKIKQDPDGKIYFTFGKYKDQPLSEVYKKDAGYFDWILTKASDFPTETRMYVKKILERLKA